MGDNQNFLVCWLCSLLLLFCFFSGLDKFAEALDSVKFVLGAFDGAGQALCLHFLGRLHNGCRLALDCLTHFTLEVLHEICLSVGIVYEAALTVDIGEERLGKLPHLGVG